MFRASVRVARGRAAWANFVGGYRHRSQQTFEKEDPRRALHKGGSVSKTITFFRAPHLTPFGTKARATPGDVQTPPHLSLPHQRRARARVAGGTGGPPPPHVPYVPVGGEQSTHGQVALACAWTSVCTHPPPPPLLYRWRRLAGMYGPIDCAVRSYAPYSISVHPRRVRGGRGARHGASGGAHGTALATAAAAGGPPGSSAPRPASLRKPRAVGMGGASGWVPPPPPPAPTPARRHWDPGWSPPPPQQPPHP